jgi:hypothetical protein
MCYTVFVSTDSDLDLGALPSAEFIFAPASDADIASLEGLMKHRNVWYLSGKYGGCSCHFRHLTRGSDWEFSEVVDWHPEDEEDVNSTQEVFDALAGIVLAGCSVDIVDLWANERPEDMRQFVVKLSEVDRCAFRFFENSRFELVP